MFLAFDDHQDRKLAGIQFITCECGRAQVVLAEPVVHEIIAEMIEQAGSTFDVFLCQDEIGICSNCGCEIALPVPEMLDVERGDFGRLLAEMAD